MFEITYSDNEMLENYIDAGKAYKGGIYDFTFEKRYLIYHAPLRHKIDYIAIDLKTGLSSSVITKKPNNLYHKSSYKQLIPHILYSVKYTGDHRYLSRFADRPLEVIDSIFRVVLANNGYNIREEQIALSKKIYIGFTSKQVSLCEAEVGTGKTLAYLVAAIVAKNHNDKEYGQKLPVTITTSSIELQRSIVQKEIPNLSKMLMDYHIIEQPLTAVVRKGKDHFFCQLRYNEFMKNIRKHPEKYGELLEQYEKIGSLPLGIDLDRYRISNTVKNRICIKGSCVGCSMREECEYSQHAQKMYYYPGLDFQVTNHNMYLMSQKTNTEDRPPLLRESCFVVVDEAHKFKAAAEDTFGERICQKDVSKYLAGVKHLRKDTVTKEKFKFYIDMIRKENNALFTSLRRNMHLRSSEEESGNIIKLKVFHIGKLNRLKFYITELEKMKIKQNYGMPVTSEMLLTAIDAFCKEGKNVVWLDTDENGVVTLCCTPKKINNILRKRVWDKNASFVLTSATISDGTDFEYFKEENGLDRIAHYLLQESRTESPFDYANHTRLYIPKHMPIPTPENETDEYYKAVADETEKIIRATNGHTAVLFTSYKALSLVYERIKDRLADYELICMSKSNKNAIADFKKSKNGILFASGSMWEGVDCIGDCLSSVIIAKLPFPMPSALLEERREECETTGDFVNKYCTPDMLTKLRQGVGRLVRSETDTGVVTILDPRADYRTYGKKIAQALHYYPRVNSVEEISSFIKSVKSEDYFNNTNRRIG